jgi:hypothetical protein
VRESAPSNKPLEQPRHIGAIARSARIGSVQQAVRATAPHRRIMRIRLFAQSAVLFFLLGAAVAQLNVMHKAKEQSAPMISSFIKNI